MQSTIKPPEYGDMEGMRQLAAGMPKAQKLVSYMGLIILEALKPAEQPVRKRKQREKKTA